MITFKQFLLNEQMENIKSVDEAVERILVDCRPFLSESGFKPNELFELTRNALWRGMDHIEGSFVKFPGMRKRKPMSSAPRLHALLNRHLEKRFGLKYRSFGLFVSNNWTQAYEYGTGLFLIFPIGDFKYVYSDVINDAFIAFDNDNSGAVPGLWDRILSDFGMQESEFIEKNFDEGTEEIVYDKWFDLVERWLDKFNPYTDKNLKGVLQKPEETEIMLQAQNFYALRVKYEGNTDSFGQSVLAALAKKL